MSMNRRIASQVHRQVSRTRLQRVTPAWYDAVLEYPPIPLPAKYPPPRSRYDTPQKPAGKMRAVKPRPLDIRYLEDGLRRQFFRDHPFEAFRPTTLVEKGKIEDPHPIQGTEWSRLRQRGRNPTPEDAIRFAVNLHEYHEIPLSEAYAKAVAQFRALRSEHHVATTFAVKEAESFGIQFGLTEIEMGFEKEKKAMDTWKFREEADPGEYAAAKKWSSLVREREGKDQWTKGQEYVRLWKDGVRPSYLSRPKAKREALPSEAYIPAATKSRIQNPDFMGLASTVQSVSR